MQAANSKLPCRRVLIALLIVELVLLGLFIYGYYRWTIEWRLNGIEVTADVMDTQQIGDEYLVTYQFTVDNQTYTHQRHVTGTYFATVTDSVPVVYSPIDPEASTIPGQGRGDFDVARLPGTFFDLRFLAYALPILILLNTVLLIGMMIYTRRQSANVS